MGAHRSNRGISRHFALHLYAALCLLTGLSGLLLTLWNNPASQAQRLELAASQLQDYAREDALDQAARRSLQKLARELEDDARVFYPFEEKPVKAPDTLRDIMQPIGLDPAS